MQSFKPDCVFYLAIYSQGKPAKYGYALSLVDERGRELFTAAKFIGIASKLEVEMSAMQLGLEQAARLKQEKLEIRLGPGTSADYLEGKLPREEQLKLQCQEIQKIYLSFRLRRFLQVPREQLRGVAALAAIASQGIRSIEDIQKTR